MELRTAKMIALGAAAFCCCGLVGCGSHPDGTGTNAAADTNVPTAGSDKVAMDFKERQRQLFYEIDHKLICQSCQQLMRVLEEGRLSSSTYYWDDSAAKLGELPEPIRALQPTYVHVTKIITTIGFLCEGRMQQLLCLPDAFTQALQYDGRTKGWGYRAKGPTERLSGTESLDYLNGQFDYFEFEIGAGLSYAVSPPQAPRTWAEAKKQVEQETRQGDEGIVFMERTIRELAVKKQRLLYRTDHQELLRACREAIKRFNEGAFSTS